VIDIILNGESHKIAAGLVIAGLLENLDLDPTKVAVERNLEIVPKTTYQDVELLNGDRLEIVYFMGGGR
jgi:thiazole synthase